MRTAIAQRIRVTGLVQGVGFRPFVWRLANELGVSGWVRNDSAGVEIHAEANDAGLEYFLRALQENPPPLARIDGVTTEAHHAQGLSGFAIDDSRVGEVHTMIGADTAVCEACLAELFDPHGRRWRHAFITCTHCGPRYTLTRNLPYDRAQTSMAGFAQCPTCLAEYTDPAHRRFHSETNCCPACGPQLALLDANGNKLRGDPIEQALALLHAGAILAIKGLGGFHLACDARNHEALERLRVRKERDEKPFAVMAANIASITDLVRLDALAKEVLLARERPVVLVPAKAGAGSLLAGVAPGLDSLGVMLPYTPLQWLLFHEAAGRPAGVDWMEQPQALLLVMTSANPGGEPLTIANAEALERLTGIADAFLIHDRDILIRCDDSVVRPINGRGQFVRRARGYTPQPVALPAAGPSVLAVGAWLKNTVCVTRDAQAWVSQHVGDLDNAVSCGFLEETVEHLLDVLDVLPQAVAHDLHPDFHSTRFAQAFAARQGIPAIAVQHHHAHIAALAAEHGYRDSLLGLALDGVGLGSDGAAWGGELLLLEGAAFSRLGHVASLPLPGGDRAAREPWRMAAAALWRMGRGEQIARRFAAMPAAAQMATMLERNIRSPQSTSMGRLFDAAAALLGVRLLASYEGQAAMQLECLAAQHGPGIVWQAWTIEDGVLDFMPLLERLADWRGDVAEAAAAFHATLAAGLLEWSMMAARREGVDSIALGGGCFLNALLSRALETGLREQGMKVLVAKNLPPNDGGISLGQAWVALRSMELREFPDSLCSSGLR